VSDADHEQTDRIDDDEVVYLRVPREPPFHTPNKWLTTANFSLDSRTGELGLSVYRHRLRTPHDVLNDPAAAPNSLLVSATVGEIRRLKDGRGQPLSLDVVPADEDGMNPGHAEIRSQSPGRLSRAARKALRDSFARSMMEE